MSATATQSLPLGIRFQADADDARFMRYFDIVQRTASAIGGVFFLDTVDDRCVDTDDMDLGDLAGWLVLKGDADEFSDRFRSFDVADDDSIFYTFAVWSFDESGDVAVTFSDQ